MYHFSINTVIGINFKCDNNGFLEVLTARKGSSFGGVRLSGELYGSYTMDFFL